MIIFSWFGQITIDSIFPIANLENLVCFSIPLIFDFLNPELMHLFSEYLLITYYLSFLPGMGLKHWTKFREDAAIVEFIF